MKPPTKEEHQEWLEFSTTRWVLQGLDFILKDMKDNLWTYWDSEKQQIFESGSIDGANRSLEFIKDPFKEPEQGER
jgi:hypothetical protein